jgi:8-oxo-dGTP pyrophosphatase MutT (NUDIX family)
MRQITAEEFNRHCGMGMITLTPNTKFTPIPPSAPKPTLPVGVSVLLTNTRGELLLGRRKNNTASGLLSTPGGRVEPGEHLFECAAREFLEETGASISTAHLRFVDFKEHFRYGGHYIMFYVHATYHIGEIVNVEPNKCEGWNFVDTLSVLPSDCTEPPDVLLRLRLKLYLNH